MEFAGKVYVAAAQEAVWAGLDDPALLARCSPAIQAIERTADEHGRVLFNLSINAAPGGSRALAVTVSNPPRRLVLVGEGVRAEIWLAEDGAGTLLNYEVSLASEPPAIESDVAEFVARLKAELEITGVPAVESFAAGASDSGLASGAAESGLAGDADTGMFEGGSASGSLAETAADPQALPAVEAARGGIPPVVWGTVLVIAVAMVLAWQLL